VIEELAKRRGSKTRAPDLKMDFNEDKQVLKIHFDDDTIMAHALAMLELGTGDDRVFKGMLNQISELGERGKSVSESASNFVLGVVAGIEPKGEIEAMLATQMAVTYQMTMAMGRRLIHVETIPQQDAFDRAFNKLARTFTTQMDALKKYRAKAQQTVPVERVTVNEDGQAIVGNIETGGRATDGK